MKKRIWVSFGYDLGMADEKVPKHRKNSSDYFQIRTVRGAGNRT